MENLTMEGNEEMMKALDEIVAVNTQEIKRKTRKRSSILKPPKSTEDDFLVEDVEKRKSVSSKRVSFADKFQVMELCTGNVYDISGKSNSTVNEELNAVSQSDVHGENAIMGNVSWKNLQVSVSTEIHLMGKEVNSLPSLSKKHKINSDVDLEPERKRLATQGQNFLSQEPSNMLTFQDNDISVFKKYIYNTINDDENYAVGNQDMGLTFSQNTCFNSNQSHVQMYNKHDILLATSSNILNSCDEVQDTHNLLQSRDEQRSQKSFISKHVPKEYKSMDTSLSSMKNEQDFHLEEQSQCDIFQKHSNVKLCPLSFADVPFEENKENIYVDVKNKNIFVTNTLTLKDKTSIQISQNVKAPSIESKISDKFSDINFIRKNPLDEDCILLPSKTTEPNFDEKANLDKTSILNHSLELTCIVSDTNLTNKSGNLAEELTIEKGDVNLLKKHNLHYKNSLVDQLKNGKNFSMQHDLLDDQLDKTKFSSTNFMEFTCNPLDLTNSIPDSSENSINGAFVSKSPTLFLEKDTKLAESSHFMELTCNPEDLINSIPDSSKVSENESFISKSLRHSLENKTEFDTANVMELTCKPGDIMSSMPCSSENNINKNFLSKSLTLENKTVFDYSHCMELTCKLEDSISNMSCSPEGSVFVPFASQDCSKKSPRLSSQQNDENFPSTFTEMEQQNVLKQKCMTDITANKNNVNMLHAKQTSGEREYGINWFNTRPSDLLKSHTIPTVEEEKINVNKTDIFNLSMQLTCISSERDITSKLEHSAGEDDYDCVDKEKIELQSKSTMQFEFKNKNFSTDLIDDQSSKTKFDTSHFMEITCMPDSPENNVSRDFISNSPDLSNRQMDENCHNSFTWKQNENMLKQNFISEVTELDTESHKNVLTKELDSGMDKMLISKSLNLTKGQKVEIGSSFIKNQNSQKLECMEMNKNHAFSQKHENDTDEELHCYNPTSPVPFTNNKNNEFENGVNKILTSNSPSIFKRQNEKICSSFYLENQNSLRLKENVNSEITENCAFNKKVENNANEEFNCFNSNSASLTIFNDAHNMSDTNKELCSTNVLNPKRNDNLEVSIESDCEVDKNRKSIEPDCKVDKNRKSIEPDIVYAIKQLKSINPALSRDSALKFPEVYLSLKKQPKTSFSCSRIHLSREVQDAFRKSRSFSYAKKLSFITEFQQDSFLRDKSNESNAFVSIDKNYTCNTKNPSNRDSELSLCSDIPFNSNIIDTASKTVKENLSITRCQSPKQITTSVGRNISQSLQVSQVLGSASKTVKKSLFIAQSQTPKQITPEKGKDISSCFKDSENIKSALKAVNKNVYLTHSLYYSPKQMLCMKRKDISQHFRDSTQITGSASKVVKKSLYTIHCQSPKQITKEKDISQIIKGSSSVNKSSSTLNLLERSLNFEKDNSCTSSNEIVSSTFNKSNTNFTKNEDTFPDYCNFDIDNCSISLVTNDSLDTRNFNSKFTFNESKKNMSSNQPGDKNFLHSSYRNSVRNNEAFTPRSLNMLEKNDVEQRTFSLRNNSDLQYMTEEKEMDHNTMLKDETPKSGNDFVAHSLSVKQNGCANLFTVEGNHNMLKQNCISGVIKADEKSKNNISSLTLANDTQKVLTLNASVTEISEERYGASYLKNQNAHKLEQLVSERIAMDKDHTLNEVKNEKFLNTPKFSKNPNQFSYKCTEMFSPNNQSHSVEITKEDDNSLLNKEPGNGNISAHTQKLPKLLREICDRKCDDSLLKKDSPHNFKENCKTVNMIADENLRSNEVLERNLDKELAQSSSKLLKSYESEKNTILMHSSYISEQSKAESNASEGYVMHSSKLLNEKCHKPFETSYITEQSHIMEVSQKKENFVLNEPPENSYISESFTLNSSKLSGRKNIEENAHKLKQNCSSASKEVDKNPNKSLGNNANKESASKAQNNQKSAFGHDENVTPNNKVCESDKMENMDDSIKKLSPQLQIRKEYMRNESSENQNITIEDCNPEFGNIGIADKISEDDFERIHSLRKKFREASEKNGCLWSLSEMDYKKAVFEILDESVFACYLMYVPLEFGDETSSDSKISFKHLKSEPDSRDELGFSLFMSYAAPHIKNSPFCADKLLDKLSKFVDYALLAKSLIKDVWLIAFTNEITIDNSQTIPRLIVDVLNLNHFSRFSLTFSINLKAYPQERIMPEIKHLDHNIIEHETIISVLKEIEPGKNYLCNMVEAANKL